MGNTWIDDGFDYDTKIKLDTEKYDADLDKSTKTYDENLRQNFKG